MYDVRGHEFKRYGTVHALDTDGICATLRRETALPEKPYNLYEPSCDALERDGALMDFLSGVFGDMDVQAGFCNGYNSAMNALEYHKSSEVGIAATDLVLLLGDALDIAGHQYDSNRLEAFYVPGGTCFELYAGVLHFSPCKVSDDGFRCLIALPRGTNTPLRIAPPVGEKPLFKRNKWLLAHSEAATQRKNGAHCGITGDNFVVKYK